MELDFIEDENVRVKVQETVQDEVQSAINKALEEQQAKFQEDLAGLKENHDKLLDEKKKLQQKFEGIDDPEEALRVMKLMNEDENAKLYKEGRFQEVIDREISQATSKFEEEIMNLTKELDSFKSSAELYQGRYNSKMVDDALRAAAVEHKTRPEAVEDILNRGRNLFSLGEDGTVEARDKEGKLKRTDDDKVLTPSNWLAELKPRSPHWWPPSQSGGYVPDIGDMDDLDAKIAQAAQDGKSDLFRKLRKKKAEMGGQS